MRHTLQPLVYLVLLVALLLPDSSTASSGKDARYSLAASAGLPGELIVKLARGVDSNGRLALAQRHGGTIVDRIDALDLVLMRFPALQFATSDVPARAATARLERALLDD